MAGLSDEVIERALERASRDLDGYLGWPPPVTDALRLNPLLLTEYEAGCLARATAEQAAYVLQRGAEDVSVDQDGIAATGGISFASTPPPRIGPAARDALAGAGLYARSGCAPADDLTA